MRARAGVAITSRVLLFAFALACSKRSETSTDPAPAPMVDPTAGARVMVGEHGFVPGSLALAKGPAGSTAPVTFLRTTDATCAKEVVFPDVGIKKDLPLNTPVTIDVPADAARTLTFQCGMAMYNGALVVK
jgi:hypothetical protein